jgi:Trk K+ transport system NAD-binding subunit
LPDIAEISTFKKNINKYESLDITFMAGEALNWNSYERININSAQKIVMLLSEESEDKGQNRKIARFILSHPDFTNFDADFVIETVKLEHSRDIYDYIFKEMKNRYSLVDNSDLMSKFLNRSIINQDYFQIYSELLSFDGSEFYQLDNRDVFGEKLSFIEANQRFEFGILIGFIHEGSLELNPKPDMMIEVDDVLVAILEDTQSYSIKESYTPHLVEKKICKPHLRENKKICIIGDYSDIDIFKIRDFLTDESIKAARTLIEDEYFDKKIWENLRKSDVDIIILNLEDEYEFALSLYLKNIYANDQKFLSKIVNIIHSPLMAKLIQGKDRSRNIILSKKIAGEYLTQVMFNPSVVEIFDEITQAKGSEFYVLTFEEYPELLDLSHSELKEVFAKNEMVYIGGFDDEEFVFDLSDLKNTDRIVVLAQGVQK